MSAAARPRRSALYMPASNAKAIAKASSWDRDEPARELAGDLIATTLGAVGKRFSESPRAPDEIEAYAAAMADMFCAYLAGKAGITAQASSPTPGTRRAPRRRPPA